jgi:GT2 family glycosyltransferase
MKVGYVCTNYNNSAHSREAVRSLLRDSGEEYRIVVVDNNSDSKNVEALKKVAREFPQVKMMVVGNNDLVFPSDFAESLRRNQSTLEKYAVVSPDIVTLDGAHQNPHVIRKIGKLREFIYNLYYANYYLAIAIQQAAKLTRSFTDRPDETQHKVAQEIYQGYGACYVLGPVFFRHFEELWAPTFLMHEEFFLSKQLSDKGLSVYYEPSIKVLHCCHGAMAAIAGREAWEAARAAQKIYRQHVRVFS